MTTELGIYFDPKDENPRTVENTERLANDREFSRLFKKVPNNTISRIFRGNSDEWILDIESMYRFDRRPDDISESWGPIRPRGPIYFSSDNDLKPQFDELIFKVYPFDESGVRRILEFQHLFSKENPIVNIRDQLELSIEEGELEDAPYPSGRYLCIKDLMGNNISRIPFLGHMSPLGSFTIEKNGYNEEADWNNKQDYEEAIRSLELGLGYNLKDFFAVLAYKIDFEGVIDESQGYFSLQVELE